jgi:hypothetical protein
VQGSRVSVLFTTNGEVRAFLGVVRSVTKERIFTVDFEDGEAVCDLELKELMAPDDGETTCPSLAPSSDGEGEDDDDEEEEEVVVDEEIKYLMQGINGAGLRKRIARRFIRYHEQSLLEQRLRQEAPRNRRTREGSMRTKLQSEV